MTSTPQNEESTMTEQNKEEWIEAKKWAKIFHDTYERMAPHFGYETRTDTKDFDEKTVNGKLMIAVCGEVLSQVREEERETVKDSDIFNRGHILGTVEERKKIVKILSKLFASQFDYKKGKKYLVNEGLLSSQEDNKTQ